MIIMINSCARDRDCHDAIRETWGKDIMHRFVLGRGNTDPAPDELIVDADDGYEQVWQKARRAIEWAYFEGHQRMFQCDVDTYVLASRLINLPPEFDYIGYRCDEGHASGGAGYFLRKRAMRALLEQPWPPGWHDLTVGKLLADHHISLLAQNDRFVSGIPKDWTNIVSAHLSPRTGAYTPDMMLACHASWMKWNRHA